VCRLLGWIAPEHARKIRAGKIPLRDLAAGEFILFNSYAMCGLVTPISSFFLLLLEEFGLQLHYLTPHSVLLVAVFAHFMEMFMGVRPCTTIFRYFYTLVGTGRSKREVGAYYFKLRHGMANSYISAFSSSKWEDWREGWVIAEADPHNRLELPTEGPQSDRSTWKAKPSMPEELVPVLNRVKELARGGLTSMMVLGDFLKRRIAPLQQLTRMAYMYKRSNDCCKIARGPGTDFTRVELEVAIRGMTGDAFSPESLVLPSGVKALCEDQALRSSVLASMPTLDEGSLAVRQQGGDPNRGIHIPSTSPNRQQRASQGPRGPSPGGPAPAGKGKDKVAVPKHRHKDNVGAAPTRRDDEAQGAAPARSSQAEGSKSQRLQRGDGSFVGEPAPKRQKTAEAERQSRAPPPPPQRQQPERRPVGSAAAFSGTADSSAAIDVAASSYTTTAGAEAANPAPAAKSASGWGPPPKVRGILGGNKGPPNRPGRLGVVRFRVSGLPWNFLFLHLSSGP
jgi:hypothetical protein